MPPNALAGPFASPVVVRTLAEAMARPITPRGQPEISTNTNFRSGQNRRSYRLHSCDHHYWPDEKHARRYV
jgi:hypothetical protein